MCVDGVGETETAAWWDVDDATRGWERKRWRELRVNLEEAKSQGQFASVHWACDGNNSVYPKFPSDCSPSQGSLGQYTVKRMNHVHSLDVPKKDTYVPKGFFILSLGAHLSQHLAEGEGVKRVQGSHVPDGSFVEAGVQH